MQIYRDAIHIYALNFDAVCLYTYNAVSFLFYCYYKMCFIYKTIAGTHIYVTHVYFSYNMPYMSDGKIM